MKKSALIVVLLLGCGLAIHQIVMAQKSGGELNVLEELGLSDLPAPPEIKGDSMSGTAVLDVTSGDAAINSGDFSRAGQWPSSDEDLSSASGGRDTLLTPLEDLDGGQSSVDAFRQAVESQRKQVRDDQTRMRRANEKIQPGQLDPAVEAAMIQNLSGGTNERIRVLQTEPEFIYVREDGSSTVNQDAVRKLFSGATDTNSSEEVRARAVAGMAAANDMGSVSTTTSFAKDLMSDIGYQGPSSSQSMVRSYADISSTRPAAASTDAEAISAWEEFEERKKQETVYSQPVIPGRPAQAASGSATVDDSGLGFFPDNSAPSAQSAGTASVRTESGFESSVKEIVASSNQATTRSRAGEVTGSPVIRESSPVQAKTASMAVPQPQPGEPARTVRGESVGPAVAAAPEIKSPVSQEEKQSPVRAVINELFKDDITDVSATARPQPDGEKVPVPSSADAAAASARYFDQGEPLGEMVDLDEVSVSARNFDDTDPVIRSGATNSPEVDEFLKKYGEELGYEKTLPGQSLPQSSAALRAASYNNYQEVAQTAPGSMAAEEDYPAASNEIVPFIAIDDADLTAAIRQLARQAGINFIFDPKILAGTNQNGEIIDFPKVTVRFENVTALQALEAVLDSYGLALEPNRKTRIAKVSYKRPPQEEPLVSEVIQLQYHSPDEMVELLQSFVNTRSSLQPHNKSSKIVVSATKEELEKIAELVYELDIPSRNVLIEANILETSRSPRSLRGIDWSGTFESHQLSFGNGNTTGTQSLTAGGSGVNSIETRFSGNGISMVTGGFSPDIAFLNSDGLNAVLNFLNSDTQTRVVATPRTVTQNAVEALLEVTRAFPIFQESPGSQAVPATTAIIYTNLGTILRVTPRISADDSVMLQVSPEVSNVDGKDQSQVGGRISEANIYAIRRMETTVRVPSGHTLVMGGLTSDTRTRKQNKVPLLGDIPLLGKAFQNREKNQENQNLIVFITPTIVREDDYQQSETDFLRTKFDPGESDITFDSMWDSAEPYSW